MFTSKHYEALAIIIRDTWIQTLNMTDTADRWDDLASGTEPLSDEDRALLMEGVVLVAIRLADNLAIDNPNFDRTRFFHACRLPGLT
jgi:hypothetical protein